MRRCIKLDIRLLMVGLAGLTCLAGENLVLTTDNAEPALRLLGSARGRAMVLESDDMRNWEPTYSFHKTKSVEPLPLALLEDCRFFRVMFTNYLVPPNFAWIPPGEFLMGSPTTEIERRPDEGPQRVVRIHFGFWLNQFEVTVKGWEELMPGNPSAAPSGSMRPVENITWEEAVDYCHRRTIRDRERGWVPPACRYRLPTEAEWEYACRAGTTTRYSFGDDLTATLAPLYCWGSNNSDSQTHPVGAKIPNPWVLFDMHGNVFEWCLDLYEAYPGGVRSLIGQNHVYRGGSWYCPPWAIRSASRHPNNDLLKNYIGFRLLLGAEPDTLPSLR